MGRQTSGRRREKRNYLGDKWNETPYKEELSLPTHLWEKLVYGTEEEATEACGEVHAMERRRGKQMLSEAGWEWLYDQRSMAKSRVTRKKPRRGFKLPGWH